MTIVDLPDVVEFASKDIYEKHLYSMVVLKEVPPLPLLISAEAKADGIAEWDGPDYQFSVFTNIFYADGSVHSDTYLCFSPGEHGWERQEYYCRPRLPIKKMRVDYFFEHKAGRVAYRNFKIEQAPRRPEPDKRIVLLGASNVITSYLAPQHRLDAYLKTKLAGKYPHLNVEIENAGVGGEPLQRFLDTKRYERDLATLDRIDVIFVRYGGNDYKFYKPEKLIELLGVLMARLRADFPGIKIVLETGTYADWPKHFNYDLNAERKAYDDAIIEFAGAADGLVDIRGLLKREVEKGNWDLRYRATPMGKLILDDRFDAGHEDDPDWYSNVHHNPNANRVIAQGEFDCIVAKKLLEG